MGTSLWKRSADREREAREKGSGSVINTLDIDSRKSKRNDMKNKILHSHQTQHDIEERDHLREHFEGRALQAAQGENFAQRKLYSTECDMEITDLEEIQNMVANWSKRIVFIERLFKKLPRN